MHSHSPDTQQPPRPLSLSLSLGVHIAAVVLRLSLTGHARAHLSHTLVRLTHLSHHETRCTVIGGPFTCHRYTKGRKPRRVRAGLETLGRRRWVEGVRGLAVKAGGPYTSRIHARARGSLGQCGCGLGCLGLVAHVALTHSCYLSSWREWAHISPLTLTGDAGGTNTQGGLEDRWWTQVAGSRLDGRGKGEGLDVDCKHTPPSSRASAHTHTRRRRPGGGEGARTCRVPRRKTGEGGGEGRSLILITPWRCALFGDPRSLRRLRDSLDLYSG